MDVLSFTTQAAYGNSLNGALCWRAGSPPSAWLLPSRRHRVGGLECEQIAAREIQKHL